MRRWTLEISAAIAVVAATAAGVAVAQDHPGPAGQSETRAEAQARAGGLFDKLDLNHDGKLDHADRVIRMNAMFDRIDTDHNGAISRDEFMASHDHMTDHGHGGPDRDDMPGGPDHNGGGHDGGMGHWGYGHRELKALVMVILHRADPGHTGAVTRAAFVSAALALFDEADTNHDGILTPEEHRAAGMAMRQHMHMHMEGQGHHGDAMDGGEPMGDDMAPPAH